MRCCQYKYRLKKGISLYCTSEQAISYGKYQVEKPIEMWYLIDTKRRSKQYPISSGHRNHKLGRSGNRLQGAAAKQAFTFLPITYIFTANKNECHGRVQTCHPKACHSKSA
jgi:hypothetical protein